MKNSRTSVCGETSSCYLGERLGGTRKPLTISGRVKEFALPFRNHKTHSAGSAAFEGAGFVDPCVADVTFATGRVSSSWESAEPSQTTRGARGPFSQRAPLRKRNVTVEITRERNRSSPQHATPSTRPRFPLAVLRFPGSNPSTAAAR